MGNVNWVTWNGGGLPTYGLYGGPGWTDGQVGGTTFEQDGVDALDEALARPLPHDELVQLSSH